jgi:uncharacterized protein (TIGR03086 family)
MLAVSMKGAVMDTVELYRRTTATWADRVRHVGADQWNAPTPCPDWDVRALVNHVVGEQRWLPPLMAGATIEEVGDRFDGDLLGTDPATVADVAAAEAAAAVPDAVAEERTVHLSFGDTPADEYALQVAADQLIHAWDLAAATGGDRHLDPEAVAAVAEWFGPNEEMYRAGGAIAARVETTDQDPQSALLAAFGRDPAWK